MVIRGRMDKKRIKNHEHCNCMLDQTDSLAYSHLNISLGIGEIRTEQFALIDTNNIHIVIFWWFFGLMLDNTKPS